MNKPNNPLIIVVDAHNIMHRAYHSTGKAVTDKTTGSLYGFFQEIEMLRIEFSSENFVFCFDSKTSERQKMYPEYKSTRIERYASETGEDRENRQKFYKQIDSLREKLLPYMGYTNCHMQEGYEADDLIAQLCFENSKTPIVIVSSDSDLFQLLKPGTCIWNPYKKRYMTYETFKKQYSITPSDWVKVKAIAGCTSDDIGGVRGVGEKTAIKWIRGEIDTESHKGVAIATFPHFKRNLKLVKLPFENTKNINADQVKSNDRKWNIVMEKFHFKDLKRRVRKGH